MIPFEAALTWHLQHNLYPPAPLVIAGAAKDAINAVNEEDPQRLITLPSVVTHRIYGAQAPAIEIVEMLNLGGFITEEEQ